MELNEARVDELDIKSVINFAIATIRDASRFWIDATIDQKTAVPTGIISKGLNIRWGGIWNRYNLFSFQFTCRIFQT
jgi:hypothetical protein